MFSLFQGWKQMQNFPGIWPKIASKMWFVYKFSDIFVRKGPKYPSKWYTSPQNCKDFPPKAKFPGNKIPKFPFFSMHGRDISHLYQPLNMMYLETVCRFDVSPNTDGCRRLLICSCLLSWLSSTSSPTADETRLGCVWQLAKFLRVGKLIMYSRWDRALDKGDLYKV